MVSEVNLWSKTRKEIMPFAVALVNDDSVDDEETKVLTLTNDDEVYRFSPNTTEEELLKNVSVMNSEKEGQDD